ncbi:MAG TPA: ABC-type transport auxiliary lipoprotein family protein [Microvirga sp.]|nr:ABC-type transport auxiliary lipoprotein family protein [Microvirga sp.]
MKAASAAAVFALAACSSGPAPTTYDLSAATGRARGAIPGQLVVGEPAAVQVLASQQLIVKDATGSVSFLGAGQWADTLPRLVQARLIHTLENSSQLRAVARPSSGAAADVQLISEIRSFEIQTPANEAVVQISAKLVSDQGRIINGRIFTGRVPVAAVDAAHAARALDAALSGVMLDVVRWVTASRIPVRTELSPAS